MEDIKIIIDEKYIGQRIDKVLSKEMTDYSRTQIQLLIQIVSLKIIFSIYAIMLSANNDSFASSL